VSGQTIQYELMVYCGESGIWAAIHEVAMVDRWSDGNPKTTNWLHGGKL